MAPDAAALVAAGVRAACMAKAHRRTVAAVAAAVTASCLQHASAGVVSGRLPCNQRVSAFAEKSPQDEAEVVDARRAARRRQRQRKRARLKEMVKEAQRISVAEDGVGRDRDFVEDSSKADVMSVQGSADGDSVENTTADELDQRLEMASQQIPGLDVDAIRDWLLVGSDKASATLSLKIPDAQRDKATLFKILPALRH